MQPLVLRDCVNQICYGNRSVVGLMVESFLEGGNQPIPEDISTLKYGCSVTDACLDWPATERMIRSAREALHGPLKARA
jgi:3-deoxy-7-phosphoheptulonate synthase